MTGPPTTEEGTSGKDIKQTQRKEDVARKERSGVLNILFYLSFLLQLISTATKKCVEK